MNTKIVKNVSTKQTAQSLELTNFITSFTKGEFKVNKLTYLKPQKETEQTSGHSNLNPLKSNQFIVSVAFTRAGQIGHMFTRTTWKQNNRITNVPRVICERFHLFPSFILSACLLCNTSRFACECLNGESFYHFPSEQTQITGFPNTVRWNYPSSLATGEKWKNVLRQ